MGFKDDLAEHLEAEGQFTVDQAVAAVLGVVSKAEKAAVLVEPFNAQTSIMVIGCKEKGGKSVLKNVARGASVVGLFQRSAAVSPTVEITITSIEDSKKTRITTEIVKWSQMSGSFHKQLVGRDPHKVFLTDLASAIKQLDSEAVASIRC